MKLHTLNIAKLSFPCLSGMALVVLFFLVTVSSYGQVKSAVDTTVIRIGEEITYTIEVEADSTSLILFPEGQSFQPLEVIDSYDVDTTRLEAKFRLIKKYGLTQFDSGYYRLPSQRVVVDDRSFMTDSAMVEVRDVPVDTTQQKMFDIKPAMGVEEPPFNVVTLLYWLIPLLLIGLIAYILFRRKKRKEEREKQLPPYEEAMVALKELDASQLLIANRSKDYYSSLTEIVKRYIDREIDDTALESTSDELIQRLQLHKDSGHFDLDGETIKKLDAIFKRADLVKFAKMKQESGIARADRSTIEEIINETKEAIPEPTEEELLQNERYAEEQLRKRRFKRILFGSFAGVAVLFITLGVLASVYGWGYLKDNVIGHPTKDLVEGRWYKSEYGVPAVIVEAPFVLKRTEVDVPDAVKEQITSMDIFAYGSLRDMFYLVVNSTQFKNPIDVDLDQALEGGLVTMEQQGVQNLVVKKEGFETEDGLKGQRAYGTFNVKLPNGKLGPDQNYQLVVFGQKGALQQVTVASRVDDPYAEEMVDRIMNSVELELQDAGPNPKGK